MNVLSDRWLFCFFLIFGFASYNASAVAQTKHALIVGIGKYQPGNGWNTLHGDADIDLMRNSLVRAGFDEANIATIRNEQATKTGIVKGLQILLNQINAGDIIVFHFSGHGQQIMDLNGDEADGLDEALIPYDAPAGTDDFPKSYNGNKHLIDDELEVWFTKLRARAGAAGQLIVFIDACHSGTVSRGNGTIRGDMPPLVSMGFTSSTSGKERTGYWQNTSTNGVSGTASLVLFSGAQADQSAYEYREKGVGSLTYAVTQALDNHIKSKESSFRDLYEIVRNQMALIVPYQTPDIEGDRDAVIFGGAMVVQDPYFTILKIEPNREITISGGSLFGVSKGAQVGFFPVGTRTKNDATALATGRVVAISALNARVKLEKPHSSESLKGTRVFLLQEGYIDLRTKVFADNLPAQLETGIKEKASSKQVNFVNDKKGADIFISLSANGQQLRIISGNEGLDLIEPVDINKSVTISDCNNVEGTTDALSFVSGVIKNLAVNNILKTAGFSDNNFGVRFQMLPGKLNHTAGTFDTLSGAIGDPVFNTSESQALIRITNTGVSTGYVYVVEFDPQGKVCPILGFREQIKLEPGRKYEFPVEGYVPPYGKYFVKTFITSVPIGAELQMLLNQQSSSNARNDSVSVFLKDMGEALDKPATARSGTLGTSVGGTTMLFSYEIIR